MRLCGARRAPGGSGRISRSGRRAPSAPSRRESGCPILPASAQRWQSCVGPPRNRRQPERERQLGRRATSGSRPGMQRASQPSSQVSDMSQFQSTCAARVVQLTAVLAAMQMPSSLPLLSLELPPLEHPHVPSCTPVTLIYPKAIQTYIPMHALVPEETATHPLRLQTHSLRHAQIRRHTQAHARTQTDAPRMRARGGTTTHALNTI